MWAVSGICPYSADGISSQRSLGDHKGDYFLLIMTPKLWNPVVVIQVDILTRTKTNSYSYFQIKVNSYRKEFTFNKDLRQ